MDYRSDQSRAPTEPIKTEWLNTNHSDDANGLWPHTTEFDQVNYIENKLGIEIIRLDADPDGGVKMEFDTDGTAISVELQKYWHTIKSLTKELLESTRQIRTENSSPFDETFRRYILHGTIIRIVAVHATFDFDDEQVISNDLAANININHNENEIDRMEVTRTQHSDRSDASNSAIAEIQQQANVFAIGHIDVSTISAGDRTNNSPIAAPVTEETKEQVDNAEPPNDHQQSSAPSKNTMAIARKRQKTSISENVKGKLAKNPDKRPLAIQKSYKCKDCAKKFVRPDALARHVKVHQRKLTSFQCSTCQRKFLSEKSWKLHKNGCQRGLRQYECYLCEKVALNKSHLLKHMRTHIGQTNRCSKCRKCFASDLGFLHHMKQHAELFEFQCSRCRQVFSRKGEWKNHTSRCKMKQYKCNTCNRVFVNKSHLNYHLRTHSRISKKTGI